MSLGTIVDTHFLNSDKLGTSNPSPETGCEIGRSDISYDDVLSHPVIP